MATIEPRLIHLLNDSTPKPAHIDLPPPHVLPFHASSDRPPRSYTNREDLVAGTDGGSPAGLYDPLHHRRGDDRRPRGDYMGAIGLQSLLRQGEVDAIDQSSHNLLSKILDDTPETSDDASNKKRHRIPHGKEDFLQLPQPVKKQKAAPVDLPPIINGLHEPPPHAALFPPISSTSFDEEHDAAQLRLLHDLTHFHEEKHSPSSPQAADKNSGKGSRKRAAKPRRKWSEEETNHLLLGVSRHGVGKWTTILDDADFKFNDRTAGDLKDRFRTCCPAELRGKGNSQKGPQRKAKKGIHSENILHEDEESIPGGLITPPTEGSDVPSKQKKSRAHRKKMEDLENLGILAPFKKSHRRERRAFTKTDDEEILQGLERYGPAWTKIQRDPRFHLSSRQPTDLRDRIRNKYPAIFQNIEKGVYTKDTSRSNDVLEPTAATTFDNSLTPHKPGALESRLSRTNSGDEPTRWPLHSLDKNNGNMSPSAAYDYHTANVGGGGEMDISRLLLDDRRHP